MAGLDTQAQHRAGSKGRDLAVVALALVAAGLTWVLLDVALDVSLVAASGDGTTDVGIGAVLVSTLLAGIAAAALLWLMEARLARGRTVWTVLAVVTLLLSFMGPASGETTAAVLGLGLLHVVVGASLVGGLLAARRG